MCEGYTRTKINSSVTIKLLPKKVGLFFWAIGAIVKDVTLIALHFIVNHPFLNKFVEENPPKN